MDLKGVNNKINNIYAGTKFIETKMLNLLYLIILNPRCIYNGKYKHKRFIHVNPLDNFVPNIWANYSNYERMNLSEFKLLINNMHSRILNT